MESELKRKLQELSNPLLDDYNASKFKFGMKAVDCIGHLQHSCARTPLMAVKASSHTVSLP